MPGISISLLVNLCLYCLCFLPLPALSQIPVAPGRYRIEFTDKNFSSYSIEKPAEFLSQRAIERRLKQNIPVTGDDLPVSQYYIDSLQTLGFEVLHTSKWFNSAVIRCSGEDTSTLRNLAFVKDTRPVLKEIAAADTTHADSLGRLFSLIFEKESTEPVSYSAPYEYYGQAAIQTGMLNGHVLHHNGFRGKGILIAVIDAGFYKADELSGFERMRSEGRLKTIRNFTTDAGIFGVNTHGTNVLSIIAADLPGQMVGSAPDADYVLIRSEEIGGEYIVEEDNWIAAVEYADSIGVDLISCSLGYSVFDDPHQNHCASELDGRTTLASQAATIAARKGMLLCLSAGNEGDMPWKYISVPSDADSIVTIGAVDRYRKLASFSSIGYTTDGRIKPDLTAMGKRTSYQGSSGDIISANGTSYSTPLLAGFMACLWQAFPEKNNQEIIGMVKQTADRYHHPDSLYGYGIPDFSRLLEHPETDRMVLSPALFSDSFTVYLSPAKHGNIMVRILTVDGRPVYDHQHYLPGYDIYKLQIDGDPLEAGMYFVEVRTESNLFIDKIVKL